MNIFFLNSCPQKAARDYCDRHCSKMVLEMAQMFCTNFHLQDISAPYKPTHPNHPSTRWIREAKENFNWAIAHCRELCDEKTRRFGKPHKSEEVLNWVVANAHKLSFDQNKLTKFAIAISEDSECRKNPKFSVDNPVEAYRLYYIHDKAYMATWKYSQIPEWFKASYMAC